MIVLGINDGHNASAAILKDGKILAVVNEERLTRRKNEYGYPAKAVEQCLAVAGLTAKDIDSVAVATKSLPPKYFLVRRNASFSIADYWREQREYWHPRIYGNEKPKYLEIFKDKIDEAGFPYDKSLIKHEDDTEGMYEARIKLISTSLGIAREKITVYDHHSCHAYYGYYANPAREKDVLVYVADGAGDNTNGSVWLGKAGAPLQELARTNQCNIGRLYRYVTLLLGMKQNEHEYKVMGLAPYSNEYHARDAYKVFSETLQVDGLVFKYKIQPKDLFFYYKEKLETVRFDGIAYAVQKHVEDLLEEWFRNGIKKTGIKNVVFSGGVALNIKANKVLWEMPEVDYLYAAPAPGDESISIGAAYQEIALKWSKEGKKPADIPSIDTLYLGKKFSDEEVEEAIRRSSFASTCNVRKVATEDVAAVLAKGEVVGRLCGRMEFGPRALGNRSILADPRNAQTMRIINEMIKQRDFWMPFTPSILEERKDDYLINPKKIDARFMAVAFDSTPLARQHLPAALHPYDFTARPQLVSAKINPEYHALIKAFEKITGVGALLNTSFNLHGEPIVESPADAIHTLERSGLQHLLVGNWLISKKQDSTGRQEAESEKLQAKGR